MNQENYIRERLGDPWWRLNNLYWITDKAGRRVKFRLNWAQRILYSEMWYLNLILKARQLGMTTFIQLFMLDRCLFNSDINAGVIAHNREDAEDFFDKKIGFAYQNLPDWLRAERTTVGDSAKELSFNNGSSIRVGTSLRSGTYQYLHVSEFGKVCSKYPDKAKEIISGSLNTVQAGQFVWIESTADGAWGRFYELCIEAERKLYDKTELTPLDYKFFFFPWFKHPEYRLDANVEPTEEQRKYFSSLESQGIELEPDQKAWYIKKLEVQKGDMKQEFPSTPDEAFEQVPEGAIYATEMRAAKEEGRITRLPVEKSPVHTFWDLGVGRGDWCSIWLMQHIGAEYRFIDFIQGAQRGLDYYVKELQKRDYVWGKHYLPHDGDHNDAMLKTPRDHLQDLGLKNIEIVPRVPDITFGIQDVRMRLPACHFDKDRCAEGIRALQAYHYETDERRETSRPRPDHDWSSHAADAFRQFAQGYRANSGWAGALDQKPKVSERRKHKQKSRLSTDVNWRV
jgi:hypothetical protein